MRHGWFVIDGVQTGDRTLAEQRLGVERALAECKGKTVLDLGCAEGLLTKAFAVAGARRVHGIDAIGGHLEVAQNICLRQRQVSFTQDDLNKPQPLRRLYDIVLALGVLHKLADPGAGVRYAAAACQDLMLVRMSRHNADGVMRSKFAPHAECNVNDEMAAAGFVLEGIYPGPREETVHYYRKVKPAR